jgi:hypothetical protein
VKIAEPTGQNIINNDFQRPWFEKIQTNAREGESNAYQRPRGERAVIFKNAAVNRHGGFLDCGLTISD